MVRAENLILQKPLFQFVSAFNSFSLGQVVWEQYEKFAIPTIKNSTKALNKALDFVPTFSPEEAKDQLKFIKVLTSKVSSLRKTVVAENDDEFAQFKNATLAFFLVLDKIEIALEKAANQSDSTRAVFHHMTRFRKNPAIGKYLK